MVWFIQVCWRLIQKVAKMRLFLWKKMGTLYVFQVVKKNIYSQLCYCRFTGISPLIRVSPLQIIRVLSGQNTATSTIRPDLVSKNSTLGRISHLTGRGGAPEKRSYLHAGSACMRKNHQVNSFWGEKKVIPKNRAWQRVSITLDIHLKGLIQI